MPQLKFNQQLALLPATVPEFILDFLEGLEVEDAFAKESFASSMTPEFLAQAREQVSGGLRGIREGLQNGILGVQVEPFGRDLPNAFWCKLVGDSTTRGIGFVMKSKTGNISKVIFQNSDFNDDELKKNLGSGENK